MQKEVNEEKRTKFIEFAGKRVNNVLHDIQILEPMSRSNSYDFTKQDVDEMFEAMQNALNDAREEFNKKFEEKERASKKVFSFGSTPKVESSPVATSSSPANTVTPESSASNTVLSSSVSSSNSSNNEENKEDVNV